MYKAPILLQHSGHFVGCKMVSVTGVTDKLA
jgi:hypothetical protein